jgi:hypothetical protein
VAFAGDNIASQAERLSLRHFGRISKLLWLCVLLEGANWQPALQYLVQHGYR